MSGTATVVLASRQDVLTVPNAAIRTVSGVKTIQMLREGEAVAALQRGLLECGSGVEVTTTYGTDAAFISAGGYHHHIGLNTWHSKNQPPAPRNSPGLYHVAILYPDRMSLGAIVKRLVENKYPVTGASDHGVSEAVYLSDPDGNGIELYRDRPASEWPKDQDGGIAMYTRPLDLEDLLREAE